MSAGGLRAVSSPQPSSAWEWRREACSNAAAMLAVIALRKRRGVDAERLDITYA